MSRGPIRALALGLVLILGAAGCTSPPIASRSPSMPDHRAVGSEGDSRPSPAATAIATVLTIGMVQGSGHRSPLEGQYVRLPGVIVTGLRFDGFFAQDRVGDGDRATSDGVFVYLNRRPDESGIRRDLVTVRVGDVVDVEGTVTEFRPRERDGDLSVTQIVAPRLTVRTRGNAPPDPVLIGSGGRSPPSRHVDDDATDAELDGQYQPDDDAIDIFESVEGMRVRLLTLLVVGPRTEAGEIVVIAEGLTRTDGRNSVGGGVIELPGRVNPDRIVLDEVGARIRGQIFPDANVGDVLKDIYGVLDYRFGTYRVLPEDRIDRTYVRRRPPTIHTAPERAFSLATLNVENLHLGSDPARVKALATLLGVTLSSPDVIVLQEVQDDSGPTDDGVVAATRTLNLLTRAIGAAGGARYVASDVPPEDKTDGGLPGANIRTALLYRPDREVRLRDAPSRLGAHDPAFMGARKPLIGAFRFRDTNVTVVGLHLSSRIGDAPLFGRLQPALRHTEGARTRQADAVGRFVRETCRGDPACPLIVAGDVNDGSTSAAFAPFWGAGLVSLGTRLKSEERYSYVFQGNAIDLDQMWVPAGLAPFATYQIAHVNADFANRPTDHDPQLAWFRLGPGRTQGN